MQNNGYSNREMLAWLEYFSVEMDVSPEKIKMLNVCMKKKNVLPTIETHKRVMIFVNDQNSDLLFQFWEAGFGDYELWMGIGCDTNQELVHTRVKDILNKKITQPSVLFVINENTRESYRVGIKNEYFSAGTVRYVGPEIRAVIMSMLAIDVQDTLCIVSGESIVVETAIAASEGTVIAVEKDAGSMRTMVDNIEQFGVHNVEVVANLEPDIIKSIGIPRLAFIVASTTLEEDVRLLLQVNPKMQFIIYTLELTILADIRNIFAKYRIENMEAMQISIAKTDKNSVFVSQPSPWQIGRASCRERGSSPV